VPKSPVQGQWDWLNWRHHTVTYPEFLTYLFDREQTKELAVELAFVIDEHLLVEQRRTLAPA
jgi:hypothetical protein